MPIIVWVAIIIIAAPFIVIAIASVVGTIAWFADQIDAIRANGREKEKAVVALFWVVFFIVYAAAFITLSFYFDLKG